MRASEPRENPPRQEKAQLSCSSVLGSAPDFLLVNPAAGGGRAAEVLPRLRSFAQQQNWTVDVCVTESPEDLAAKARAAVNDGHRRLFVLGGDGTFQVLLNTLRDQPDVLLGIIPAGGGNDLAAALGLPPDPLRAASELLRHGEACCMDAVRVRTAEGRERWYTAGGGVGIDAAASRYASGVYRNLRGRIRYLLSALRALCGFHSFTAIISIGLDEPRVAKLRTLLVAVLNTPSYGGGIYLAPDAKTADGLLDLVILEDRSLFNTLRLLPSLWSKGHLNTDHVQRFRVTCVRIETEKPCYFHGDGEILGMTPVEISIVPRAFRALRVVENER